MFSVKFRSVKLKTRDASRRFSSCNNWQSINPILNNLIIIEVLEELLCDCLDVQEVKGAMQKELEFLSVSPESEVYRVRSVRRNDNNGSNNCKKIRKKSI